MQHDRRNVFAKIGLLGAGALAWTGLPKAARADASASENNPLLGLWEVTLPDPGYPTNYYKMAISEGAYVTTSNLDADPSVYGFTYAPTFGTYARVAPTKYRFHDTGWVFDPASHPAGSTNTLGIITVSQDRKSFSAEGLFRQYDASGKQLFAQEITFTGLKSFA
jgi:hypothetical protein